MGQGWFQAHITIDAFALTNDTKPKHNEEEREMNKVRQLLNAKGHDVWTISKDATILEALKIMSDKKIGSLVVLNDEEVVGIFTERDHARKVGLMNRKPEEACVHEVMTVELIKVTPDHSVNECMELMTEKRVRHLPVFEDGRLAGIISIGDVVKDIIEELQFLVTQLEKYIAGLR
jgi:CBS domain-containing protein